MTATRRASAGTQRSRCTPCEGTPTEVPCTRVTRVHDTARAHRAMAAQTTRACTIAPERCCMHGTDPTHGSACWHAWRGRFLTLAGVVTRLIVVHVRSHLNSDLNLGRVQADRERLQTCPFAWSTRVTAHMHACSRSRFARNRRVSHSPYSSGGCAQMCPLPAMPHAVLTTHLVAICIHACTRSTRAAADETPARRACTRSRARPFTCTCGNACGGAACCIDAHRGLALKIQRCAHRRHAFTRVVCVDARWNVYDSMSDRYALRLGSA